VREIGGGTIAFRALRVDGSMAVPGRHVKVGHVAKPDPHVRVGWYDRLWGNGGMCVLSLVGCACVDVDMCEGVMAHTLLAHPCYECEEPLRRRALLIQRNDQRGRWRVWLVDGRTASQIGFGPLNLCVQEEKATLLTILVVPSAAR
jgi:hypothetical protein